MSKQATKEVKNAITKPETGQKGRVKGAGNHPNSRKNLKTTGFSSTIQPDHYRGPTMIGIIKLALLKKLHQKSTIKVKGRDIITGKTTEIFVDAPNLEVIVTQWLRKAGAGDMKAIELLAERIDGKVALPIIRGDEDPQQKERVILLPNNNTLSMW